MAVDVLLRDVEAIGATDRSGWSGAARSAEVLELLAAQERLATLVLRVVGEWDRDQAWAADGAVSPVAWISHRAPLTRQASSLLMRAARHVAKHEKTAKALDAGDISVAHVELAARAAKHREAFYPEHEDGILDAARALPPRAFAVVMAHWRHCADAVADHEAACDDIERNYFEVNPTFEGVGHLEGRLDALATAALIRRLDDLESPDPTGGPNPPRTLAQRRADALLRLVYGESQRAEVGIDVIVDMDTLAGRAPADLTNTSCDLRGFGPVSPALVQLLACDAAIGRVLARGASEVLDLGRRTRLVTSAQRRMLEIRDHGCVEEGCDAPPEWCDAHHIVPWWQGGHTNVEGLELRCRRHHIAQHVRLLRDATRRRE